MTPVFCTSLIIRMQYLHIQFQSHWNIAWDWTHLIVIAEVLFSKKIWVAMAQSSDPNDPNVYWTLVNHAYMVQEYQE